MAGNLRWKFHDPEGTLPDFVFPINPSQMDPPDVAGFTDSVGTYDGGVGTYPVAANRQAPLQWTFKGVAYGAEMMATLNAWVTNARPIHISDHYGQVWRVLISDITADRKQTRKVGRQAYTASTLMLGRVS
jgi:hypothetical protein